MDFDQYERASRADEPDDAEVGRYELPAEMEGSTTVRWTQLLREPHRRLVIKGGPGSGKSFITRHTAVERLRQAQADLEARRVSLAATPMTLWTTAIALAEATGDTVVDRLVDALARSIRQPLSAVVGLWLETAFAHPQALIILDGLDEVPAHQLPPLRAQLSHMIDLPGRIILTCRTLQWEEQQSEFVRHAITEVELVPLTPRDIRQFIQKALQDTPARAAQLTAGCKQRQDYATLARRHFDCFSCASSNARGSSPMRRRTPRFIPTCCVCSWKAAGAKSDPH